MTENTNQEKPRYTVFTAADALKPQPPIEYVLNGLFSIPSVNLLYGSPATMKTLALIDLCVCVSSGKPWLEFDTVKCPVLFIDEESGRIRFLRRLGDALRGELCTEEPPEFNFVSNAAFKLDNENDVTELEILIIQTGAKLIVIDALSEIMDGDENAKKDVQPVFNAMRKISENTESAIVIIHHKTKAENGSYRGSSAIEGNVDMMLEVNRSENSNVITFKPKKDRDGVLNGSFAAEVVFNPDEYYLKSTQVSNNGNSKREEYIINFLYEHGASTVNEIIKDAENPQSIRTAIYPLVKNGTLVKVPNGKREAMYELKQPEFVL